MKKPPNNFVRAAATAKAFFLSVDVWRLLLRPETTSRFKIFRAKSMLKQLHGSPIADWQVKRQADFCGCVALTG